MFATATTSIRPSARQPVQAPSSPELSAPAGPLRRGSHGPEVEELQRSLNGAGAKLPVNGQFGPRTEEALKSLQTSAGLEPSGVVGPATRAALAQNRSPGARPELSRDAPHVGAQAPEGTVPLHSIAPPTPRPPTSANKTASFDRVSKQGRDQMVEGKVTINGNSYSFRSGGWGRGSLPAGEYKVTANAWNTRQEGMNVGGVGYKFNLSDKYDPRVGDTRTQLLIHPDGGTAGTRGCVGIVGDVATQRRFREDMRAELARNGGSFTLRVGP
ncbi:MAG: peptidoglycan-binding protein [Deltaproteobacteria bacterium]|nr:peptidoglycan-binding protein [Deltaproteobacteria bacterium]